MGKRKSPEKAADREKKWDNVFNALVKLSQNLQKDRQILEDRIKSLHQVIYKMKMEQKVESANAEFMLGLKDREAFIFKHRYENADNELADFREWFDYLSEKCSEPKDTLDDFSNKGEGRRNKALQNEVRKLKSEIEKCKSEKNSEISALLQEKNFVWNQYKMMESNYTKLRKKSDEVEHANERLQALVNRAEELQISNEKLKTDFAKMESESVQKSEEILRLSKKIELLKSKLGSVSPLLRPCTTEAAASDRAGKNSGTGGRGVTLKKETDPSHTSEKMARRKRSAHKSTGGKAPKKQFNSKGSSSSKRKATDVVTLPDTPKLFTSSFKVPKLKSSSTPQRV
ncbi:hypothetical protein Salat_1238100 [Sesamum alatum]|uniref:Uncharacterized protein n=1 Tax=Sesamum alatum TaxID=300844 RepID=A0AAE2CP77_9LAMI|nr:hypothetical protein Salat_1238100 [Sesamum alatum]